MNKQPTQEQIKEFWGWCGFKSIDVPDVLNYQQGHKEWCYPDLRCNLDLPEIDLNNLFKYAVPRLTGCRMVRHLNPYGFTFQFKCNAMEKNAEAEDQDPTLALFWAIYSIIDKSPPL